MTRDETIEMLTSMPGLDVGQTKVMEAIVDALSALDLIKLDAPKTDITIRVAASDQDAVHKLLQANNIKVMSIAVVDQLRGGRSA